MFIKSYKIFESPDIVEIYKNNKLYNKISIFDNDAVTFGYDNNKMITTKKGFFISHEEILSRSKLKYSGRLWTEHKIITFWNYPETEKELNKIIKDIENAYNNEYLISIKSSQYDENKMKIYKKLSKQKLLVFIKNNLKYKLKIDNTWKIEIVVNNDNKLDTPDTVYWNTRLKYLNLKTILIPISEYKGSLKRTDKELNKNHILSPMKKKNIKIPNGIGANNRKSNVKRNFYLGKYRGENLITNYNKFLFESPDRFSVYDEKTKQRKYSLTLSSEDAITFGYDKNEMLVTRKGEYIAHDDITSRLKLKYPGRIWVNHKIITFWKYPENEKEFKKIIKDIENTYNNEYLMLVPCNDVRTGEKIISKNIEDNCVIKVKNVTDKLKIDNTWKIEIVIDNNNKLKNPDDVYWGKKSLKNKKLKTILIPITEYEGSLPYNKEELNKQHIISPTKKKKKKVPNNIGANNRKSSIKRNFYLGKFRGETKIQKFNDFLF